jgi:hypothetical protein
VRPSQPVRFYCSLLSCYYSPAYRGAREVGVALAKGIGLLLYLALAGLVIYVPIHFIVKYW